MTKRKANPVDDAADDLEILHPERELQIAGVKITMREYGFVEGMRLAGAAAPVVHDLAALSGANVAGSLLEYANLQAVFAKHVDAIVGMVAQACDQPVEWVSKLQPVDGENLLLTWWAVNGPFFVRRVITELQMRVVNQPFDGAKSTPRSPRPDTAPPTASDGTHAVN